VYFNQRYLASGQIHLGGLTIAFSTMANSQELSGQDSDKNELGKILPSPRFHQGERNSGLLVPLPLRLSPQGSEWNAVLRYKEVK
jgi:hypothetical protein